MACPKFVRDRVPICPLCGDLCRKYQEVTEKRARLALQKSGFGAGDFVRAIRYPMQHKTALFGGALVYGLLGVIIFAVTSSLALPYFGNVFAQFIDATFTFYLNLVIACVLGLSLFKCADRLDIHVD